MPIRMEEDQQEPQRRRDPDPQPQPNQPKRKMPLSWILLALYAVIKKPKWLIPIVIILGLLYLLGGGSFFQNLAGPGSYDYNYQAADNQFSFGAELSEEEYDKASVFEPLAVGSTTLPARASLENYTPRILHQGSQGSCSGWASAYGARTVSYARATGQNPDQVAFSPSFLYNQIALPRCEGAYLNDAMEAMRQIGSVPFTEFGYTDRTCQIMPDNSQRGLASQYRIKGYTRLTRGAGNYTPDMNGIKQHLAQGAPVVIGMMVGNSFQRNMMGREMWTPSRAEYAGSGLGGHAMCVVGYDDRVGGGAFRIMNSWGENWGDDGFTWVRYNDFNHFVKEAYGIYPEGEAEKFDRDRLAVKFALVENESQSVIPLRQTDEIVFRTERPISVGTKFKLAITNNVECYTYIFGMETDGSSYVLFPYTQKHSPYCGITGTRLFPKDYSMTPDNIGSKDVIAIVVSKQELNFDAVNSGINRSRQPSYMLRMAETLQEDFVPECDFDVDGAVGFDCNTQGGDLLGMIIEIDKR